MAYRVTESSTAGAIGSALIDDAGEALQLAEEYFNKGLSSVTLEDKQTGHVISGSKLLGTIASIKWTESNA